MRRPVPYRTAHIWAPQVRLSQGILKGGSRIVNRTEEPEKFAAKLPIFPIYSRF